MNKPEASALLRERLAAYRALSYTALAERVGTEEHMTAVGPSGVEYQVEVQVFWDGKPDADVRVMGSIDDGGLRAFVPLCESFIMGRDGQVVGESGA
jgi:hypothetical protein